MILVLYHVTGIDAGIFGGGSPNFTVPTKWFLATRRTCDLYLLRLLTRLCDSMCHFAVLTLHVMRTHTPALMYWYYLVSGRQWPIYAPSNRRGCVVVPPSSCPNTRSGRNVGRALRILVLTVLHYIGGNPRKGLFTAAIVRVTTSSINTKML